jgi:hypothetical protein
MKRTSMAQALSQAAGHSFSRPSQTVKPKLEELQAAAVRRPAAPAAVPPSRVGKKPVTAFFDPEVSRQIKKLGLDQDKTMQDLLQEALNDLFRKYDLPPIA